MSDKMNLLLYSAGAVVLVFGGIFFLFPGFLESIGALVSGSVNFCSDAPNDLNCICGDGLEKQQYTPQIGSPQFFCESQDKFLDPNNPNYKQLAIDYAKQKFSELYPDCDMKVCNDSRIETGWVVGSGYFFGGDNIVDRRLFQVDCDASTQLYRFAGISFDAETGAINDAYCGSYDQVVQVTDTTKPAKLELKNVLGFTGTNISGIYEFSADCSQNTGIATATLYTSEKTRAIFDPFQWKINNSILGGFSDCSIIESAFDHLTFKCDALCSQSPTAGFSGPVTVTGKIDSTVCKVSNVNSNPIYLNSGEFACQQTGANPPFFNSVQCNNGSLLVLNEGVRDCKFVGFDQEPITSNAVCAIGFGKSEISDWSGNGLTPSGLIYRFDPATFSLTKHLDGYSRSNYKKFLQDGSLSELILRNRVWNDSEFVCGDASSTKWQDPYGTVLVTPKFDVLRCDNGLVTAVAVGVSSCNDSGDRSQPPIYG